MRAGVVHDPGHAARPSQPFLLSFVCLFLLPLSFTIASSFYFLEWLKSVAFPRSFRSRPAIEKKRVIVTGDSTSTTLAMARVLRSAGHAVYVVGYEKIPFISSLRSSNAVTRFIGLSTGRVAPSITAVKAKLFHLGSFIHISFDLGHKRPTANIPGTILRLIESEKINMWIPCETKASRPVSQAQDVVLKHSTCRIFGPNADAAKLAQNHRKFAQFVERLGLDIHFPSAMTIKSRAEIHRRLSGASKAQKYLIEKKSSPLKDPILPVTGNGDPGLKTPAAGRTEGPYLLTVDQDYQLLPRASLNETYSSVAAISISQEQPWLMHELVEGKPTSVSALIVNSNICVFMASTASQSRTFSTATRKGKAGGGPLQAQHDITEWQQHETPHFLDPSSAIAKTLLDFTRKFASQLPEHTNAQINLHFIMAEASTSDGAVQKFWATGCDFIVSPLLIQQALSSDKLESIGAAYSCVHANEELVLLPVSTTLDHVKPQAIYSLPSAIVQDLLVPFSNVIHLRAPPSSLAKGVAEFLDRVTFGQEELFDRKDLRPWIWTWFVQFPTEEVLDLVERAIDSWILLSKRISKR